MRGLSERIRRKRRRESLGQETCWRALEIATKVRSWDRVGVSHSNGRLKTDILAS